MTTKTAPCMIQPPFGVREANRKLTDGAPRHAALIPLIRQPWMLRVDSTNMLIRGATPRDLAAVATLHARCSPQSLLDRYRLGGKAPAIAGVEQMLRRPLTFVAVTSNGDVLATATATVDACHTRESADVAVLVEDKWQDKGVGRELVTQLAAAALVCGYTELIGYTATSPIAAQRLMLEVGHTRVVNSANGSHMHTYLPESAALGLGAVRERLAS
jgi:N-acetylglutamate synthase-like GNAT family acetyltransferase